MDLNEPSHPSSPALGVEREVEAIYAAYSAELLAYASSFVRGEDGALDAVQEAFLRYFVERSYGRTIENPRGWLYRVLRNYLLDRQERAAKKNELSAEVVRDVADPRQSAEAAVVQAEAASRIVSQLSGRELECFRLRADGASYGEIAETLGIRMGTVSALLTRVHKKLRALDAGRICVPWDTLGALCFLVAGGNGDTS